MRDNLDVKLDTATADRITILCLENARKDIQAGIESDLQITELMRFGSGHLQSVRDNFQTLEAVNRMLLYFTGDTYD